MEQEVLENFPDIEWEPPVRVMGRLILLSIINSLKNLTDSDMLPQEEVVERLRREGF